MRPSIRSFQLPRNSTNLSTLPVWTRAHGEPVCDGLLRHTPADFCVTEEMGFTPDGQGEHEWLWVEKIGANTPWVARQLAKHADVKSRDVGFSGMKDRHAVTRQWFSVPTSTTDWSSLQVDGVNILDQQRHTRKLKRGAHKTNRFVLVLRGPEIDAEREALTARLQTIASDGVPNYFGEQRFGHNGSNVEQARSMFAGKRLPRDRRSILLSATRAWIFNAILSERVRAGSWNQILPGECANLAGTGSVFTVENVDSEIQQRCDEKDIHPTVTLWGTGAPITRGELAAMETTIAANWQDLTQGLESMRVSAASRPSRLVVADLSFEFADEQLTLSFALGRGGYATTVVRELINSL
ncbi:MAG: tRNA pseudouridine(13) synthase TruD [Pseudomonadota bacterium]